MYDNPHATVEGYEDMIKHVEGEPDGPICHIACERAGGGLFVIELWESEEAQELWSKSLRDKMSAREGPPARPPRKLRVHNVRFAQRETR